MIYFIQDPTTGAIKIGTSTNPLQRMTELQTGHAAKLQLLGVAEGSYYSEKKLHRQFDRIHGEWFAPTAELLSFIRDNALPVEKSTPTEYAETGARITPSLLPRHMVARRRFAFLVLWVIWMVQAVAVITIVATVFLGLGFWWSVYVEGISVVTIYYGSILVMTHGQQ